MLDSLLDLLLGLLPSSASSTFWDTANRRRPSSPTPCSLVLLELCQSLERPDGLRWRREDTTLKKFEHHIFDKRL